MDALAAENREPYSHALLAAAGLRGRSTLGSCCQHPGTSRSPFSAVQEGAPAARREASQDDSRRYKAAVCSCLLLTPGLHAAGTTIIGYRSGAAIVWGCTASLAAPPHPRHATPLTRVLLGFFCTQWQVQQIAQRGSKTAVFVSLFSLQHAMRLWTGTARRFFPPLTPLPAACLQKYLERIILHTPQDCGIVVAETAVQQLS